MYPTIPWTSVSKVDESTKDTDHYRPKDLEKYAEEHNLVIVFPAKNQLQIDIDSDEALAVFDKQYPIFLEQFPDAHFSSSPSRNKPQGKHITITVPGHFFTVWSRIAYQAALGSDLKREMLCLKDVENGNHDTTLFLEKKTTTL